MADSFSIRKENLSSLQLSLIKEHCAASRLLKEIGALSDEKCMTCFPGEEWVIIVKDEEEYITGHRSVGNFDMINFLTIIGVAKEQILS